MCLTRLREDASRCRIATFTDGHGILYARPRPALAAMFYFLLKLVLLFGRDQNLPNRCGRSGLSRCGNTESFTKIWLGSRMSTSSPISCPMVSGNTGINHKITGRGLGLGDKALTILTGRGKRQLNTPVTLCITVSGKLSIYMK